MGSGWLRRHTRTHTHIALSLPSRTTTGGTNGGGRGGSAPAIGTGVLCARRPAARRSDASGWGEFAGRGCARLCPGWRERERGGEGGAGRRKKTRFETRLCATRTLSFFRIYTRTRRDAPGTPRSAFDEFTSTHTCAHKETRSLFYSNVRTHTQKTLATVGAAGSSFLQAPTNAFTPQNSSASVAPSCVSDEPNAPSMRPDGPFFEYPVKYASRETVHMNKRSAPDRAPFATANNNVVANMKGAFSTPFMWARCTELNLYASSDAPVAYI